MNTRCTGWLALTTIAAMAGCENSPMSSQANDSQPSSAAEGFAAHMGMGHGAKARIDMLDDCDPTDPGWAAIGGCALRIGNVSLVEFNALVASPLSAAAVGHPSWTNQPSYLEIRAGQSVLVRNRGGRPHTLTPVAEFGGGSVPQLSIGLTQAPECALAPGATDPFLVGPGERMTLHDLPVGIHRLQCCFHPWMRELIRVTKGKPRHHHLD